MLCFNIRRKLIMKKYSAIKDMFYGKRGGYDTIKIDDNDITILDTIIKHDENLRIELKEKHYYAHH